MFMKFWNWLIGNFCKHRWEIIDVDPVYESEEPMTIAHSETILPVRTDRLLQCVHCGDLKNHRGEE